MANKDYVRRGRSPKKPTPKKTSPKGKPWKSGLLAIIAVGAFGYGLYILNSDPTPKTPPAAVSTPVKPVKQKSSNDDLPPPPTEKWDYVDTLPSREIEVVPKELKVSKIPYIMQCGAFKTMHQAEERKARIAFVGLTSKIRKTEGSSWFRIVLGPYKFKREAEKDKHKLQRSKIEPCLIMKDNL
ncbi:SPOR domain-containing protein [Vibrio nitrifigilis]|uniref:SPOR domain-containing protein n=1 Tax=Vibrio nitrifigilis TaxID=2789781 RepID=A0ABS0GHC2_9VIBR|nr:SPOR domain-containing protein [Vibrio nitrifigilis]MBF9001828.1 SPOR domain-containing protein [Vibrio nitrifigilis]